MRMSGFFKMLALVALLGLVGYSALTTSVLVRPKVSTESVKMQGIRAKDIEMLYPVVRVNVDNGSGSGVILYSSKMSDNEYHTYIITNYHVLPEKKDHSKILVEKVIYNDLSTKVGEQTFFATVAASSKDDDLALLELADHEHAFSTVARLKPVTERLQPNESAWAVGASLGDDPTTAGGEINNLSLMWKGKRYILADAPFINGNSGGGLYHFSALSGHYELVGITSMVRSLIVLRHPRVIVPIPYKGISIPLSTVRDFLTKNGYGFILAVSNKTAKSLTVADVRKTSGK